MKKKFKNLKKSIILCAGLLAINISKVSANVSFNSGQAKSDLQNLLDPISNFLIFVALPITAVAIGVSYIGWNAKDEEEKESMPFHKVVKKHIIAFVLFGLSGAILKWFSIS